MVTDLQLLALSTFVRGRVVHDLGAGNLMGSMALLEAGATTVVAVDVVYREDQITLAMAHFAASVAAEMNRRIDVRAETFEELLRKVEAGVEALDVAFVSWPLNRRMPELVELCRRSRIVCYLGSCTDGNACGHEDLFEHFLGRELVAEVRDRANTLLIVAEPRAERRAPTAEEHAGLKQNDGTPMLTYEEAAEAVCGRGGR